MESEKTRRIKMKKIITLFLCFIITGVIFSAEKTQNYNAVVDAKFKGKEGSLVNKVKMYKSITSAIKGVPEKNAAYYTIFIKDGRYYEKPSVDKPFVAFLGESNYKTILTFDAAQGTKKDDGKEWGNMCATLNISAPSFKAENMTIENGFDYLANFAKKSSGDPSYLNSSQALAIRTLEGSNNAIFKNLRITGFQDTIFADSGTQYYKNCYVSGNVDFIYGGGQAAFVDCDIAVRYRNENPVGVVTAPCTQSSKEFGLVFFNCKIRRETPNIPKESVELGRPWHPTTTFPDGARAADPNATGMTVYINCFMDDMVSTKGWDPMSGKDKDGKTIWFTPDKDARFYEYKSTGPGAIKSESRKVLSEDDAKKFTVANVLGGWDPEK
jgi:pectinesterase